MKFLKISLQRQYAAPLDTRYKSANLKCISHRFLTPFSYNLIVSTISVTMCLLNLSTYGPWRESSFTKKKTSSFKRQIRYQNGALHTTEPIIQDFLLACYFLEVLAGTKLCSKKISQGSAKNNKILKNTDKQNFSLSWTNFHKQGFAAFTPSRCLKLMQNKTSIPYTW